MSSRKNIPLLFSGRANKPFARKVAKELGLSLGKIDIATFSDLETHVVIKEDVAKKDVFVIQSTSSPSNETLMELLLMVGAIQSMKPKRITAVIPFFGYRRQEKVTVSGEALSFDIITQLLKSAGVDRILVIDLHKHRSARFFVEAGIQYKELRAFDVIVEYFKKKKLENFVVLAPDKGGIPEAERYATALHVPLVKAYKKRTHSKRDEVTFHKFEGVVKGKNILITDDEINTAGTLQGVVDILKKEKARNIYFASTHGVLSGPAIKRLKTARLRQVIITDTIALPKEKNIQKIKVLSVAPLFAEAMKKWIEKT